MDQVKIGNFIAFLRKEQNLTQRELAERLGVTDRAVSKWENGRGLPDLSLLVPLCDILGVSVNELLCGERIEREDLPEKAQDTLLDALTDSRKKERSVRGRLIALLTVVILLFGCLVTMFAVDVTRMRNNEPIVFSSWGFHYTPSVLPLNEQIEQAVSDHLRRENRDDLRHENEQWFLSMKTYRIDNTGECYYVYAWVLEESYYMENGALELGSGSSMPYRFTVTEQNGQFCVSESKTPRDGSYYSEDMKELFPWFVRWQMDQIHVNGTFDRLDQQLQQQVDLYFHFE